MILKYSQVLGTQYFAAPCSTFRRFAFQRCRPCRSCNRIQIQRLSLGFQRFVRYHSNITGTDLWSPIGVSFSSGTWEVLLSPLSTDPDNCHLSSLSKFQTSCSAWTCVLTQSGRPSSTLGSADVSTLLFLPQSWTCCNYFVLVNVSLSFQLFMDSIHEYQWYIRIITYKHRILSRSDQVTFWCFKIRFCLHQNHPANKEKHAETYWPIFLHREG